MREKKNDGRMIDGKKRKKIETKKRMRNENK